MRLYLEAKSKNNIGYTPDWLKVSFKENDEVFEITLDIQGEISYSEETLNCRCKGDFIPWVLYNCTTGKEIVLYEMPKEEADKMFPPERISQLLQVGTDFRIGVYPVSDSAETHNLANEDILSDCKGICEFYNGENTCEVRFSFEAEYNG